MQDEHTRNASTSQVSSFSSDSNEADLSGRGGSVVSVSLQMASNVSHLERQGSGEEALDTVAKRRTQNCKKEVQTLKKLKEVSSEDVVDLTHVEELEPLDFKQEEKKLAQPLESLKTITVTRIHYVQVFSDFYRFGRKVSHWH